MTDSFYIEDIFVKFVDTLSQHRISMQFQDRTASSSFYQTLIQGNSVTQNQGSYILKILNKYRNVCEPYYNYKLFLEEPQWKTPFRIIDNSKKVWIEVSEERKVWICFRFPFQLKDEFDKEITSSDSYHQGKSIWDRERKIRKLSFYEFNLIQIYEFCKEKEFEFDDTFMEALSGVEEIWQNQNRYLKVSQIINGEVELENAPEDAYNFFQEKKTNVITSDLILAKNMGYLYSNQPTNMFETIAHNDTNKFFIKNIEQFFELAYGVEGKVVLILDKDEQTEKWVRYLADKIDWLGYDKKDFRVCFRSSNKDNPDFNKWVNENGFGGKISDAKFLIFQQKPAKWLFKDENDVIIVATNKLLPGMNSTARAMFSNHPCVVFINEYKPVNNTKETVIEL